MNTEEFIEKARKVHDEKYDYSKVEYVNTRTKVCIVCPKHGEFWQTPNKHLMGENCPICSEEIYQNEMKCFNEIKKFFKDAVFQQHFKFLGKQSLDIYIPSLNIAIEYQGIQHFKPVDFFGGYEVYVKTAMLDVKKYNLCKENNIKLFYFTYTKKDVPETYIDKVYTDMNDLIGNIKSKIKR